MAWGSNISGALGAEINEAQSYVPVAVRNLNDAIAVATGNNFGLAVKANGSVMAWGNNAHGQLGNGSTERTLAPVPVSNLSGVKAVSAGAFHSLALKTDGTVMAWGLNGRGQVGDNTSQDRHTPVPVVGLSNVVAIAAGGYHSLALRSDGIVFAWGEGTAGELGNGDYPFAVRVPVQVSELSNVAAIAGSLAFSMALKTDGSVWTWGDNVAGRLGNGSTVWYSSLPVPVSGLSGGVRAIAAGHSNGVVAKNDGTVWNWGGNYYGQLGVGSYQPEYSRVPVQVTGISNATSVAAGQSFALALRSDGSIAGWGRDGVGELGDNNQQLSARPSPVAVAGLTGQTAVVATWSHAHSWKEGGEAAPAMPTGLQASGISSSTIRLQWADRSNNETGFEIHDTVSGETRVAPLSSTDLTAYNWTGLPSSTQRCFRIRAVNAAGASAWHPTTSPFHVCATTQAAGSAPAFTSSSPPTSATVGVPYSYNFAASGSPAPAFSVASGSLPPGVALATSGGLSGVPTNAGSFSFSVRAANGVAPDANSGTITITVTTASVTITASSSSVAVGVSVTITATSSFDVQPTPFYIQILEDGVKRGNCGSGSTCTYNVSYDSVQDHSYTARISWDDGSNVVATAGPTSVEWTDTGLRDLRVTKTGPATAIVGVPISYTVTLSNQGPATALSPTLVDMLTSNGRELGGAFGQASVSPSSQGSCHVAAGRLVCLLQDLPNGAVVSISVQVTPPEPGMLVNSAGVDDGRDPVTSNNEAVVSTTVSAADIEYVALGDSYSSGEGAVNSAVSFYIDSPAERNACHRSPAAYPVKLAAVRGMDLGGRIVEQESQWGFVACSGARIEHVDGSAPQHIGEPAGQISRVGPGTQLVTVTIGGNDVELWHPSNPSNRKRGLEEIMRDCIFGVCTDLIQSNLALLGPRLEDAYRDVALRAPNATVVVLTYPQIFAGDNSDACVGNDGLELSEIALLRAVTSRLNETITEAALAAGVAVSPQEDAFSDHWICSPVPYANRLNYLNTEYSFHPNVDGHARMAQLLAGTLEQRRPDADFDGDDASDIAVYRPSNGYWFIKRSTGGSTMAQWGLSTDTPVAGNYDGDDKTDIAVWRPSSGQWFVQRSGGGLDIVTWGVSTDVPVVGDYDGDGRSDMAVWRPSTGQWFVLRSSGGIETTWWGVSGDVPLPADFDGDGITDLAVWRPGSGEWFVRNKTGGYTVHTWGLSTDVPVVGDYDGDGNADVAVWRPSTGQWFIRQTAAGDFSGVWGVSTDRPVPGDYDGDGRADLAVYRPSTGQWFIYRGFGSPRIEVWGLSTDTPIKSSP